VVLAAGVILAIMILPYIAAVSREVLLAVPAHQREAARHRGDRVQPQVRPMLAQQEDEAPHVSGPELGGALAGGGARIEGIHVVEHDGRAGCGERLEVHEVPQGELEVVHAVDERESDGLVSELRAHVITGEESGAGLGEDGHVRAEWEPNVRLRVDADRQRLGPC